MLPLNASIHGRSPIKSRDNIRVNLVTYPMIKFTYDCIPHPNGRDESALTEESQPCWSSLPAEMKRKKKGKSWSTVEAHFWQNHFTIKAHLRWKHTRCGIPTTITTTTKIISIMNDQIGSPFRRIPPTEAHELDGQFRWPIPTYSDDRVGCHRIPYRQRRSYTSIPRYNSQSSFVPADTRTPNFIYPDRRSRDCQLSMISFDLGQESTVGQESTLGQESILGQVSTLGEVSTLGQLSTLHSLCLTHPEFLLIQLVSAEHLRSMALCLKDRLANAFLKYILLQLVTFRCGWTVLRSQVGGCMARMNLHGKGTIILSVLVWASTRSNEPGLGKEQFRRQISSVLCSRNYILSKVLKADPIRNLQLEHNAVRTEEFPRYYIPGAVQIRRPILQAGRHGSRPLTGSLH